MSKNELKREESTAGIPSREYDDEMRRRKFRKNWSAEKKRMTIIGPRNRVAHPAERSLAAWQGPPPPRPHDRHGIHQINFRNRITLLKNRDSRGGF